LIIDDNDVANVLIVADTIEVLEIAYADLTTREAVCRPRIDIQIPIPQKDLTYQWAR
jgi:hypothetical protein